MIPAAAGVSQRLEMQMIERFLERRPILSSVVILLAAKMWFVFSTVLSMGAVGQWMPNAGSAATVLACGVAPLLLIYRFLARKGWAGTVGFNPPGAWRAPGLIWLPALYILVNFISLIEKGIVGTVHADAMRMIFTQSLSVPLFEESVFRGLILAVVLHRYHATRAQIVGAVLFSALLFGLWHVPLTLNHPDAWQASAARVVYTIFAGVGFAAVVLRTRSIWLVMSVHALTLASNLLVSVLTTGSAVALSETIAPDNATRSAVYTVLVTLPLLLYGLYLLQDVTQFQRIRPIDGASSAGVVARR